MGNYTNIDASALRAGLGASRRMKRYQKYTYYNFLNASRKYTALEFDGTAAVVTDASINFIPILFGNGDVGTIAIRYEQQNDSAGAAGLVHSNGTTLRGLSFTIDAADNDGIQLAQGWPFLNDSTTIGVGDNATSFKVGTDEAFFSRIRFKIDDVSDADTCGLAFVKSAFIDTALFGAHDDVFAINLNAGAFEIIYDNDNAGPTTVVSGNTAADVSVVEMEIRVSNTGVCKAFVGDQLASVGDVPTMVSPTTDVTTFAFDSGDYVYPVFYLVGTGADPVTTFFEWETGYVRDRGLASTTDLVEGAATDFANQ